MISDIDDTAVDIAEVKYEEAFRRMPTSDVSIYRHFLYHPHYVNVKLIWYMALNVPGIGVYMTDISGT